MWIESDLGVIGFRFRSGQQNEVGARTEAGLSQFDELFTDATLLVGLVDGKVGKITAILEIRNRTGQADQSLAIPGGAKQVCMTQHGLNTMRIVNWPAFCQG